MARKKILLVDDDMDFITMVTSVLKNEDYEVIPAFNKQEGLEAARREKPDVAVLDVMMNTPFEGFEMAMAMHNDPLLAKIPVIIQTSIDVLTTHRQNVQEMAHEYRKNPEYKQLQVILLKDAITGEAGIDYLDEKGNTVWVPVNGFIRKPVDTKKLLAEIKRVMA